MYYGYRMSNLCFSSSVCDMDLVHFSFIYSHLRSPSVQTASAYMTLFSVVVEKQLPFQFGIRHVFYF